MRIKKSLRRRSSRSPSLRNERRQFVADRSCNNASCALADVAGIRPARTAVACLQSALDAESNAAKALATARDDVRRCLHQARQGGEVTLTAIATAITPPKASESTLSVIRRRKRVAASLACRLYQAKLRTRT